MAINSLKRKRRKRKEVVFKRVQGLV